MKTYRSSSSSHHRDRAAQERRRLEAAKLFQKSISQAEVARKLKVSAPAVSQWHAAWKKDGNKGLRSRGKTGPKSKLTDFKLKAMSRILLKGPRASGYATDIWTLERIRAVLAKKIRIQYGSTHIWRILTIQLGWSSQKPETRAKERNEKAIRQWKRWVWPQVKRGQKNYAPV